MKRFILSALSVLLAAGSIAPAAQALPKVDANFKLQTLRLSELDARNKSEADSKFNLQKLRLEELDARSKSEENYQPYYPQTSEPSQPQNVTAEEESSQTAAESTKQETPQVQEEEASSPLSITERRQQSLDRN